MSDTTHYRLIDLLEKSDDYSGSSNDQQIRYTYVHDPEHVIVFEGHTYQNVLITHANQKLDSIIEIHGSLHFFTPDSSAPSGDIICDRLVIGRGKSDITLPAHHDTLHVKTLHIGDSRLSQVSTRGPSEELCLTILDSDVSRVIIDVENHPSSESMSFVCVQYEDLTCLPQHDETQTHHRHCRMSGLYHQPSCLIIRGHHTYHTVGLPLLAMDDPDLSLIIDDRITISGLYPDMQGKSQRYASFLREYEAEDGRRFSQVWASLGNYLAPLEDYYQMLESTRVGDWKFEHSYGESTLPRSPERIAYAQTFYRHLLDMMQLARVRPAS